MGLRPITIYGIDSDLELHIEQENPHHIFVGLFRLGKKLGWNEEELAMERLEEELSNICS